MSSRNHLATEPDGRDRILTVAIRSFAERGYDGTTTAGVAREAGVTQPLVHHHFGSKDGLWRAAMDELFAEVRMFTAKDAKTSLREVLLRSVEQFVRLSADRPEIARIIAREGTAPNARLTYLIENYLKTPFTEFVEALGQGQKAGLIAKPIRPDLLFFFFLGACTHLFDVTALAKEGLGIDTNRKDTREQFVVLAREILGRLLQGESR